VQAKIHSIIVASATPGLAFLKPDAPCACTILRRATRAVSAAYDAALAPSDLRVTQFSVLRTLARLGPRPINRLAAERRWTDPLWGATSTRWSAGDW
jgi:hypothetical protein